MKTVLRLIPAALLATACASTSELPNARTERSIVTVQTAPATAGQQLELTREANIKSVALDAEVAEAWAALPVVFEALELPITNVNAGSRSLTTIQRIRRIGGKNPSTFFRCPGPYGNLAASGDVYVSILAQVLPGLDGTGSQLRTQIDARARASTGGTQVQCSATGALEKLLAETLTNRLQNL